MNSLLRLFTLSVAGCAAFALPGESRAQLLITGNDEKVSFDENTGKTITHPAGKDTVSIIDIADPAKPRIIVNLPLMNTITGPPVNLAITSDRHLALVANSLDWVKDGEGWKGVPDNKIYVIDLTASPPTQIGTVEAGKQPSGMAINKAGTPRAGRQPRRRQRQRAVDRRQKRKTGRARCRSLPSRRPRWRHHLPLCRLPSQSPPTASARSSSKAARTG